MQKMQGITGRNRTCDEVVNLGWWPTIKKYKMQTNSVLAFQMHFRALRTLNDLKLFGIYSIIPEPTARSAVRGY